jgi:ribonucleotide reductase alpha subunit
MERFIIKRDGTTETYDLNKISNALNKAFINTKVNCSNFDEIISHINSELLAINNNNNSYNIEDIQDLVEKTLMLYKYFDTAKHYINYRAEHNKNRDNCSYLTKIPDNIKTPWGMLGYITYKRTYARRLNQNDDNDETTEEFRDTILRVLNGCQKQLKVNFTNNELEKAYKYLMELKCSVAGRFLWQLGTETVSKLGIMSLQNCAFVKIDEPIKPFLWIFDVLMLGTGVGFNIQKANINKIPPVLNKDIIITRKDTKDADFIVPDSREGWGSLLEKVLEAYFYKGNSFTYSTILIRSAGTKIKGFGGVASGPEDLVKGINQIQGILNLRKGKHLQSVDCLDIVNIIASVVVAGNVRRCLPAGSKVHTRLGLINIEEIMVNDEVYTTKGYRKVKNIFRQGEQSVSKIITSNGHFKCTKNHKMAVYDNNDNDNNNNDFSYRWVTAEELKPGDKLILTRTPIEGNSAIKLPLICDFHHVKRTDRIITPDFTPEIAWFFGFIANNSSIIPTKAKIMIDCYSLELLRRVSKNLEKFGSALRIITDIDINNNRFFIEVISEYFFAYIQIHFSSKIPYFINETTLNNRFAFINGILESYPTTVKDNSIIINGFTKEKYSVDMSNLLFSCGIINGIYDSLIVIDDVPSLITLKQMLKLTTKNYPILLKPDNYNEKVAFSTVETIIPDTNYQTYDIEIDDVHEFFCNGYLTHNSALICLGDYDDVDYLNAKRWDLGNIPNWRCMSNNSVVCDDINNLPEEFWNGYNGNGEPYGLINIELARKIGRIKDGDKYPDPEVEGFNPCLTEDTIIMTNEGLTQIHYLKDKEFSAVIDNKSYNSTSSGFWSSGYKEIYKLTLSNGVEIKATHNHKFKTFNGWKKVEDMNINEVLFITNNNYKWTGGTGSENEGYILGHLFSNEDYDYNYNDISLFVEDGKYVPLDNYKPFKKIIDYCNNNYEVTNYKCISDDNYRTVKISSKTFSSLYDKFNLDFDNNDYFIRNTSYEATIGLLRAIFDLNGTPFFNKRKCYSIILKDLSYLKLKIVQQYLLAVGIYNSINEDKNQLEISGSYETNKFNKIIGFYDNNKNYKLNNYADYSENTDNYDYSHYNLSVIVKIERLTSRYEVFDCTINDIHAFTANGLISHNCAEQSLANYETCCLSEIYLCNVKSYDELKEIAEIVYRICKHSLLLKCHQKSTEEIVHRNMRMGIGITGYLQSTEEQKSWLSPLYEHLRAYDDNYSKKIGSPISVKITTVKPSGTLSLLAGVTSGAHPAIYQYFIRRIRISSANSSLLDLARLHHYHIEYQKNFDGTDDKNTMIIEFPCKYPEGTILAKDMSAVDQLNTIKELQTNWSDNSVSVTVYYRLHELPEIKEWLKNNYNNNVKTCSFLLHNEHGFKQAPFEEITKEQYEELIKKVIPITSGKIKTIADNELSSDCVGGACPIR